MSQTPAEKIIEFVIQMHALKTFIIVTKIFQKKSKQTFDTVSFGFSILGNTIIQPKLEI
jgi:hypothetical protein